MFLDDTSGVLITAFDPSTVQRAIYGKTYRSITDLSPDSITEPIRFTEPETQRAFMIAGATPDDLVKISAAERERIPGTPNIKKRILEDLEERRLKTFQKVVEARNKLFAESKPKGKIGEIVDLPKVGKPFHRLKIKHIAGFAYDQNRRKEAAESEEEAERRLAEIKKAAEEKAAERQNLAVVKFTQKLTRLRGETINQEESEKEKLIAERNKERQVEAERISALQKEISELPARQSKLIKAKTEEIHRLEYEFQRKEVEFQERLGECSDSAPAPRRDPEAAKEGIAVIMAERAQKAQEKLERRIRERAARVEANLRALSCQRRKRFHANQIEMRKRSESAMESKELAEVRKQERLRQTLIKQQEALERAMALRDARLLKGQEHAGEHWMKIENGQHNAKVVGIHRQYHAIESLEKTAEKHRELRERKEAREQAKIQALRRTELAKLRAVDELVELRKKIHEDPSGDVARLAHEFHVDMRAVNVVQKALTRSK
jgi:hypothetical protein